MVLRGKHSRGVQSARMLERGREGGPRSPISLANKKVRGWLAMLLLAAMYVCFPTEAHLSHRSSTPGNGMRLHKRWDDLFFIETDLEALLSTDLWDAAGWVSLSERQ